MIRGGGNGCWSREDEDPEKKIQPLGLNGFKIGASMAFGSVNGWFLISPSPGILTKFLQCLAIHHKDRSFGLWLRDATFLLYGLRDCRPRRGRTLPESRGEWSMVCDSSVFSTRVGLFLEPLLCALWKQHHFPLKLFKGNDSQDWLMKICELEGSIQCHTENAGSCHRANKSLESRGTRGPQISCTIALSLTCKIPPFYSCE